MCIMSVDFILTNSLILWALGDFRGFHIAFVCLQPSLQMIVNVFVSAKIKAETIIEHLLVSRPFDSGISTVITTFVQHESVDRLYNISVRPQFLSGNENVSIPNVVATFMYDSKPLWSVEISDLMISKTCFSFPYMKKFRSSVCVKKTANFYCLSNHS